MKNSNEQYPAQSKPNFYREQQTKSPINKSNSNYIKNEYNNNVIISKLQINFPKIRICQSKKDLNESNYQNDIEGLSYDDEYDKKIGNNQNNYGVKINQNKIKDKNAENQYLWNENKYGQKQANKIKRNQRSPIKYNEYSYQQTTKEEYSQNISSYHDFNKIQNLLTNHERNDFGSDFNKQIHSKNGTSAHNNYSQAKRSYETTTEHRNEKNQNIFFKDMMNNQQANKSLNSKKQVSFAQNNQTQMTLSQLLNDLQHRSQKLYQIFGQNSQGYQKCIQKIQKNELKKQKSQINKEIKQNNFFNEKYNNFYQVNGNQGKNQDVHRNFQKKSNNQQKLFAKRQQKLQSPQYELFETSQKQVQLSYNISSPKNQYNSNVKNQEIQNFSSNKASTFQTPTKNQRKKKVLFYTPINQQNSLQSQNRQKSTHKRQSSIKYIPVNHKLDKMIKFTFHLNKFFNLYLFNILRTKFYYETGILSTESIIHTTPKVKKNREQVNRQAQNHNNKEVSFFQQYYKEKKSEKQKMEIQTNKNNQVLYNKKDYSSKLDDQQNLYINSNINKHVEQLLIQSKNQQQFQSLRHRQSSQKEEIKNFTDSINENLGEMNQNQYYQNYRQNIVNSNMKKNSNKERYQKAYPKVNKKKLQRIFKGCKKLEEIMKYKVLTILRLGFLVLKFIDPSQNDKQVISSLKISSASMKKIFQQKSQTSKHKESVLNQANNSQNGSLHKKSRETSRVNSKVEHNPVNILQHYYKKVSDPGSPNSQYKSIVEDRTNQISMTPSRITSKKSLKYQRIDPYSLQGVVDKNQIQHTINGNEGHYISNRNQRSTQEQNNQVRRPSENVRESRAMSNRSSKTQSRGSLSKLIQNTVHQNLFNNLQNNQNIRPSTNMVQPYQQNNNFISESKRSSRVLSRNNSQHHSRMFTNQHPTINNSTVRSSRIQQPSTLSHQFYQNQIKNYDANLFSKSSATFYNQVNVNNGQLPAHMNRQILLQKNKRVSRSYSENDFFAYHKQRAQNLMNQMNPRGPSGNNVLESHMQNKYSKISNTQHFPNYKINQNLKVNPQLQDYYPNINNPRQNYDSSRKNSIIQQNSRLSRQRINTMHDRYSADTRLNNFHPPSNNVYPQAPLYNINPLSKSKIAINNNQVAINTIRPTRQIRGSSINSNYDKKRSYSHDALIIRPINAQNIPYHYPNNNAFKANPTPLISPIGHQNPQYQPNIQHLRSSSINNFPMNRNIDSNFQKNVNYFNHDPNCLINVPMKEHLSKQPYIQQNHFSHGMAINNLNNYGANNYQIGRSRASKSVDSGLVTQIGRRQQIPLVMNNPIQMQANLHINNYQLQSQPLYNHANQLNPQHLQSQPNFTPNQIHIQNANNKRIVQPVQNEYNFIKSNNIVNPNNLNKVNSAQNLHQRGSNVGSHNNQQLHANNLQQIQKSIKRSKANIKQTQNSRNLNGQKTKSYIKNSRLYEEQNLLVPQEENFNPRYAENIGATNYLSPQRANNIRNNMQYVHTPKKNQTSQYQNPQNFSTSNQAKNIKTPINNVKNYPRPGLKQQVIKAGYLNANQIRSPGPQLGKSPNSIIKDPKSPNSKQPLNLNKLGGSPANIVVKNQLNSPLNANKIKKLSNYGQQ